MVRPRFSVFLGLLAALVLAAGQLAASPAAAASPVSAGDEFKKAKETFDALYKASGSSSRLAWKELEDRFRDIEKKNPNSAWAAWASYFAGRVNEELGPIFHLNSDYQRAIDIYQRMPDRYPGHTLSDDALFRAAGIELYFLKNPAQARFDCERILREYPKGDMVTGAKELLAQINARAAPTSPARTKAGEQKLEIPSLPQPAPVQTEAPVKAPAKVEDPPAKPKAQAAATAKPSKPGDKNRLHEIRFQSSDEYTRVVLDLDREASYQSGQLPPEPKENMPHRLYLDLDNTLLADAVKRELTIADGILRRVRAAQNRPTTARIVLDFQELHSYKIFAMEADGQAHLIIDVSAPGRTKTGQAHKEVRTPAPHPGPATAQAATPASSQTNAPPTAQHLSPPAPQAQPPVRNAVRLPVIAAPDPDGAKSEPVPERTAAPKPEASETKSSPNPRLSVSSPKAEAPAARHSRGGKAHPSSLAEQLGLSVDTIMIDPGHGGKDPGAQGNGLTEKDVVLRFGLLLGKQLEKRGFKVLFTRKTDEFVHLEQRTALANLRKADLFISVHCNAYKSDSISGLETYFLDVANSEDAKRVVARENAVTAKKISDLQYILTDFRLDSKIKESKELAQMLHAGAMNAVKKRWKVSDHGVHSAPFYVLMGATMPAALMELGYLTSKTNAAQLGSEDYLETKAAGLAEGVLAYKRKIERVAGR